MQKKTIAEKLVRLTTYVKPNRKEEFLRDAEFNHRTEAGHLSYIIDEYYRDKYAELEFMKPTQLHEGKGDDEELPVFRTPSPQRLPARAKSQKTVGQDQI